jgi:hypothetical protein
MATQTQINSLVALYVGYFDRAPDPQGLQFWIDQIDNGRAFNTIAEDFATSPEATALYPFLTTPDVSTPSTFIQSIYLNLFGRAAEAEGLNFWTGVLQSGSVSVADFIEAIINGAVDAPTATPPTFDKAVLDNKVTVGLDFATDAGNVANFTFDAAAKSAAVAAVNGVTEDPATVTDAQAATDAYLTGQVNVGQAFTLTTDTDSGAAFVGGSEDEIFSAPLDTAIDGLVAAQSLQGSDVLDGGAGDDMLNAELNGTGATQNPTISNIEQYNLTSYAGLLGGGGVLSLDRATGYEELWNRDSRVNLTLEAVGQVAVLGMDNVRDGSIYSVDYDNIAVDTQTVVVDQSGAAGDSVELDIDGVAGAINNFELNVSNGVFLDLDDDADDMLNLTIAGSGMLDLEGENDFDLLQTLDTLGYEGDVSLDVSGSAALTSVMTGEGDDTVVVGGASVNEDLSVDMGEGSDILTIDDVADDDDLDAIDFSGGVTGVENIAFDDELVLGDDAVLNLDGVSDDLEAVWFFDGFDADGDDLTVENSPVEDLNINTVSDAPDNADFDMDGGLLTVNDVVNLTMDAADDARIDGGLNGDLLETLVMNAGDDLDLDLFGGLDALTSIEANATNTSPLTGGDSDADVNLDASAGALGDPKEFGALNTVNVNAASNATLNMTGRVGVAAFAGTQATQSFAIEVTGSFGGFGGHSDADGDITFSNPDLPGGQIATSYSAPFGNDSNAADDIAHNLDALAELEANNAGNVINVTWADVGVRDPLTPSSINVTEGTLNSFDETDFFAGEDAAPAVAGEGFEAVETVSVNAEDGDADVDLADVYGAFILDVTATDDANVNLSNTNATSATVAAGTEAGDKATVTVDGNTVGNAALADLVVSGDEAEVTLSDNLDNFTTLDVSAVATNVEVNTSAAVFGATGGEFVEYEIGATSDGDDTNTDVMFTGNDAREVYDFVGGDIGEVEINNFTVGADPSSGDRLDFSAFAASSGELVFENDGGDLVITDLAGGLGDFGGSITIVGAGADAADMASFNILYG